MEQYNILNDPIRCQISTSKKSQLSILRKFVSFSRCSQLKVLTLKSYVKVMIYNTRIGAIRWQMHDFLSVFAFFKTLLDKIAAQQFNLENQAKVTEHNIRNGPVQWQISTSIKVIVEDFFTRSRRFFRYNYLNLFTNNLLNSLWIE